ncbi:MAG: response regulator [Bacteroidales bacterium]|nr:response regulator [Bacteroidales bacterium]
MKRYLIIFITLLLLHFQHVSAFNIIIEDINEKYGLPKNRVNCMYQDSAGFLWFGMANGLYKFDLNDFTKYSLKSSNFSGFPESDIRSIIEYEPGLLLIGTYNKGLLLFNSKTERYDSLILDLPADFASLSINALHKDRDENIWIGTNNGIFQVKKSGTGKNSFKLLKRFDRSNTNLLSSEMVEIKNAADGKVWFLSMTDLAYFNPADNTIQTIVALKANSSFIFLEQNKILKSCFETGLDIYNTQDNFFEHVDINEQYKYTQVRYVFKDNSSNLWISISNVGLILLESVKEGSETILISNKSNIYSDLNSNVIYKIYESKDGAIWLCTEEGISMIKVKPDIFKSQTVQSGQNSELLLGIRSLLDSEKGYLWIGTIGEGLKKYNIEDGTLSDVRLNYQGVNIGKNIQAIIYDIKNNLWIGTEGEGVIRYTPGEGGGTVRGNIVNYRKFSGTFPEITLENDYIMCLLEDRDNNIWIGTWYGLSLIESSELAKADQSKAVVKNFFNNPSDLNSISNNTIMSLLEDKDGNIWAGTQAGLNKIIRTNSGYSFENDFKNEVGKPLSEKKVLVITQGRNGNLWFSTQDGGICTLDPESGIYQEYNSDNGFHNDIINSISEDSTGILWLGTNNGLYRFDPFTFSFSVYKTEDGLISNDFFFASNCRVKDMLYFGGDKGITYFNPYIIKESAFVPHLVFTDFRLFNKPVQIGGKDSPLESHISNISNITLRYNQNYITLAFAALNYLQHDDIQYMCILEGLETNWNRLNKERKITYTSLNHGHYTFRVKAYSPGHASNFKELSIPILIKPPLWKTTLAYITYILLFVFTIFRIYTYFLNAEKKKHALAIERMNAKRVHEMDLMRLHFYTNISHELRTPLTLISAPLETLVKEDVEKSRMQSYFEVMLKNVQRLKRLIDQLLDLRKIEKGFLKPDWREGDIIEFIQKIFSNFENYAEKRSMYFTFQASCSELYTFFDSDKLDKIMFNLISNAFKYTPDYGTITLKLDVKDALSLPVKKTADKYLEIKLTDSGFGIPENAISKIFDTFQRVDKSKPIGSAGSGIGLSLTKELVEIHKGFIFVESKVDQGSVFTIYLPVYDTEPEGEPENEKTEGTSALEEEGPETLPAGGAVAKSSASKPLILVVEDNSDLRKFLHNELQANFRVIESKNGQEGLKQAIEKIPDLVVSDVMMDKMDGIEMCRRIKNDERTSHIPVILLTVRHSEELVQNSYDIGADDYITKPFNMSTLKIRINNLIEQRRNLRKLFSKSIDFDYTEAVTNKLDAQFIEKLNTNIEKNIDNPGFTPNSLASEMAMSKMQLYRKVSALTNQTVYNYIRKRRMQLAAKLLLTTDMQIAEVAMAVGYNEPSNFTKCFNREFNQSPSSFVKANRR